jgi:phosphoribosylformimino-5-aminoimidazole carboxamide ribotide isomerase
VQLIPAIDIMGGGVVRLRRGDENAVTRYDAEGTPLELAGLWREQGAEYLHLVDLDAALGRGSNGEIVKAVIEDVGVPVQVGGGIRSLESARGLLDLGAGRIVIGSMALEDPDSVAVLLDEYDESRVIVALDHRRGVVLRRGWKEPTGWRLEAALGEFAARGVEWFLVTDVDRDGAMEGPDLETYWQIQGEASIIASGGVRSLEDLLRLRETGVEAAVVGRALYEGRFTLAEAIGLLEDP